MILEEKKNIRDLSLEELEETFLAMQEPAFRAKQIYQWLWHKGCHSFEEMTNLSKALRLKLEEKFEFRRIEADVEQKSTDGTIKFRFRLHDNSLIESVLIPVDKDKRYTVCVSSQVGCSLACSFCATGKMKRMRNLSAAEIYDQVYLVNERCMQEYSNPITNIVYMGMGEPLLTYKNVMQSIELISSPDGMGMSSRRITISTAGISKMIKKLADDNSKVNLALSLHAADDEKRDKIMAINEQNNLASLMEALSYYYQKTKNRISYEYIAFKNFNLTNQDADNLIAMCKPFPVRVNIIEYNPIDGVDFERAEQNTVDNFAARVRRAGIMITIRRSRGRDIDAACGQLANKG